MVNLSMFIPCCIPHPHCFFIHLDSFWLMFLQSHIVGFWWHFPRFFHFHHIPSGGATWGLRTTNASTLRHELARFLKDNPKLEIAGDTLEDCDRTSFATGASGGDLGKSPAIKLIKLYKYIYIHINIIDGYWWILILLMDMNIYIYMNGASSNQLLYQLLHQLTDSARQWWT